ncbi:low temperature requirement protein A [Methylocapsa palsarum]|uniref:Low temperature requirement protein LtrA n=1 Tax=Methylocapsa palsarum TaxID=1612308 RepID=A0A1I3XJ03_9HYPH|nr:low temperature requirement protein A [Methylocapsa palsarum]SFK19502.1 Low temperature requirement protein LtrA [Methylocapsa palsarum]
MPKQNSSLLRPRRAGETTPVTTIELFFDLVFVFAVTQLSHSLLQNLTLAGALQTLILFLAVWWVWIYTSWVTNWLDPNRAPVRFLLFALMFAGLILSISIPDAFAGRGFTFASAYVFMQLGRPLFMLWALGDADPGNTLNFQRIASWAALSGLFWLAGGLARHDLRPVFFAAALAVEYAGPSLGFWTPLLGRSSTRDWNVEGAHLAERCSLFIIIALGESLLVTGAAFGEAAWTPATTAAFAAAFAGAAASWWIYFDLGAEEGSARIASSFDPGRLARLAYTYIHLLIVAGIIVSAVADEIVLSHPEAHPQTRDVAVIVGGPLIYLFGVLLFKRTVRNRAPLSHIGGLVMLALLALAAKTQTILALGAETSLILIVVSAWEWISLRRKPQTAPLLDSRGGGD